MRKIMLVLLLMLPLSMQAEDFKILFLNTKSIRIGTVSCKVGDIFDDSEKIHWKDERQAMKVLSLLSGRQYVLVSQDFRRKKLKSAKDFVISSKRLSTRGIGSLSSVSASFGDIIYWLDSVAIRIDYEPAEGESFLLKYGGQEYNLPFVDGQIIFGSDIWGEALPYPIEADILYHYADGDEELVCPDIMIVPLPSELDEKKKIR